MRKLLIIVITLVVVAVAAAGGIWGYLFYSTKQQVQHFLNAAKPLAEISQRGIQVLPSGVIRIQDIKIIPHMVSDVISINAVELHAPNIFALLDLRSRLSQGQLPESLALNVRGISLPLHGAILGTKPAPHYQALPFENLSALGCGSVTYFAGDQLQAMGYESFIGDLTLGYRLRPERISINISSATHDWATVNLDLELALDAPVTTFMQLATAVTTKLAGLTLVMQDAGYNQHRNNFCANQAGKDVPAYLAEHVRLVVERLRNHGIALGPGLIEVYQRYLTENGIITLTMRPPLPIEPSELLDYKVEDALKLAGLSLQFNDQPVSDLSVDWNLARASQAFGIGVQRPQAVVEIAPPAPPKPAPIVRKDFQPMRVTELGQHLGKVAKLKTKSGVDYQGKLESLGEGILRITIRKSGGQATLSLRVEEIAEAQIFE